MFRLIYTERFLQMLRESLAVLVAILVAFGLDAWWEERREQAEMGDALDAVAVEIGRNLDILDESIAFNENKSRIGMEIAGFSPAEVSTLSDAELASYFDFPSYRAVRLELGAVTAFVQGGYLSILDDREIRTRIAAIPRMQPEIDEEADAVSRASDQLQDALIGALSADELFGLVANPNAGTRVILAAVSQSDAARKALITRSFLLMELYTVELRTIRDEMRQTLGLVEQWNES